MSDKKLVYKYGSGKTAMGTDPYISKELMSERRLTERFDFEKSDWSPGQLDQYIDRLQRRAVDPIAHETDYTCPSCDSAPALVATHDKDKQPLHLACPECGYQEPYRKKS